MEVQQMKLTLKECLRIDKQLGYPVDFKLHRNNSLKRHYAYKLPGHEELHCSSCGKVFRSNSVLRSTIECPKCKKTISVFKTRSNTNFEKHEEYTIVNSVDKQEDKFVQRRWLVHKKVIDLREKISHKLLEIRVLDELDISSYSLTFSNYYGDQWLPRKITINTGISGNGFYAILDFIDIYPEWTELLQDSDIKYSCLDKALNEGISYRYNSFNLLEYIQTVRKYPFMEFLWKTNNKPLYLSMLNDDPIKIELKYFIKNSKKLFRHQNIKPDAIKTLYNLSKIVHLHDYLIEAVLADHINAKGAVNVYPKIKNLKSLKQTVEYFRKQKYGQHYFEDYIELMNKIGTPVDESTVFPVDLVKAHDDAVKKFNAIERALDEKNFNEIVEMVNKLQFENDGLRIVAPQSLNEILIEGKTLHHCVGSYVDKVARKETVILFVRTVDNPDQPFYTLEFKNKKIEQCRGSHNKSMTDEVKSFTEDWLKYVTKGGNRNGKSSSNEQRENSRAATLAY